jgi:anti-anti-sigma factor
MMHEPERLVYAITLDLSHGPHGANARIERIGAQGDEGDVARLTLFGWIDRLAVDRLAGALDDLADRGVRRLGLDCSRVRHIEFAALPVLLSLLARVAREPGALRLTGLSPHLRDLFRVAGSLGDRPALPAAVAAPGFVREWAT